MEAAERQLALNQNGRTKKNGQTTKVNEKKLDETEGEMVMVERRWKTKSKDQR